MIARILKDEETNECAWRQALCSLFDSSQWESSDMQRVFSQCYSRVSDSLKRCCGYLAHISEVSINALDLKIAWVMEGLVQPDGEKLMEEIAAELLEELIDIYIVEAVQRDEHGCVTLLRMDDKLCEQIRKNAEEEDLEFRVTDLCIGNSSFRLSQGSTTKTTRHFLPTISGWQKGPVTKQNFSAGTMVDNLRFSKILDIPRSKHLQIIDLQGIRLYSLPNELGELTQIKYLNLRNSYITRLPSSIGNLCKLQILDIRGTRIGEVVKSFWDISSLKHLHFPVHFFRSTPTPQNKFPHLEILNGILSGSWVAQNLGEMMNNIKNLTMVEVLASHETTLAPALESFSSLKYLRLEGNSLPTSVFTLPHVELEHINLSGPLGRRNHLSCNHLGPPSPPLPNLTMLFITNSNMEYADIAMLGALPKLLHLGLWKSYCNTDLEFQENWFPCLLNLELLSMGDLEKIVIHKNSMPCLENLCISNCRLQMLPEGLNNLNRLQVFVVKHIPAIKEITERMALDNKDNQRLPAVMFIG